jgi:hypothetical protein
MNFFRSFLVCSLLFAVGSFGSLVSKRITKEEGNQIKEAPIHVENMNGGIIEGTPFLRSNFPKWTDPENLGAGNVNDGSMKTNGVKDSDLNSEAGRRRDPIRVERDKGSPILDNIVWFLTNFCSGRGL